jgi:hypothetical protein
MAVAVVMGHTTDGAMFMAVAVAVFMAVRMLMAVAMVVFMVNLAGVAAAVVVNMVGVLVCFIHAVRLTAAGNMSHLM